MPRIANTAAATPAQLRALCDRLKLSPTKLAAELGLSRASVYQLLRGDRAITRTHVLACAAIEQGLEAALPD